MKELVQLHDKHFSKFIEASTLQKRVQELGEQIADDYVGKNPHFLVVLNGAFIFAADLCRACPLDIPLTFVRLSSYKGLESTGELQTKLGIQEGELEGKDVILVEDIVDTGNTLSRFIPQLKQFGPASVKVASCLVKPETLQGKVKVDYQGFEIPPHFVVGYGLDYDELGRTLPSIYQLAENNE